MSQIRSTDGKILSLAVMSLVLLSNIANSKLISDREKVSQDVINTEVISIMNRSPALEKDIVDSLWEIVTSNSAIMGRENVIRYIQKALDAYVERGRRIRDTFAGEIAIRPVVSQSQSPSPIIVQHSAPISKNDTANSEWFRQVVNGLVINRRKIT